MLGLGPTLLLDRYAFRLLPWSKPVAWTQELALRGVYVALGGLGYSLARAGVICAEEALCLGVALSLAAFLFDSSLGLVSRGVSCLMGRRANLRRPGLGVLSRRLLFGPAVVLALPLFALHMPRTVPTRTPAALRLPFEEVKFVTRDGLQLGGWLVPHERARGSVLFCHGHGTNRGHVLGFLRTLHDLRLNVLAFDFRGHGDSPGHTATFGRREIHDVVAAEAYLRQRFPQRPLFILGVSYGAAVALQALPELPNVRAVWSEGCFSRFSTVMDNQFSWLPGPLRRPVLSAYSLLAWLDCGFWETDINPVGGIEKVNVPIYFCHGVQDELIPFADGKSLYNAYAGPKWNYWVENAGHENLRQRAPDEYRRRLRAFFEDMLAGSSATAL